MCDGFMCPTKIVKLLKRTGLFGWRTIWTYCIVYLYCSDFESGGKQGAPGGIWKLEERWEKYKKNKKLFFCVTICPEPYST